MPEPEGRRGKLVVDPWVKAVVIVGGVAGGQGVQSEGFHHRVTEHNGKPLLNSIF